MPDRYGDRPDPDDDAGPADGWRRPDAIHACRLCDTDGYRGGFPCDHIDHAGAARRGMDMIRAALRKDRP